VPEHGHGDDSPQAPATLVQDRPRDDASADGAHASAQAPRRPGRRAALAAVLAVAAAVVAIVVLVSGGGKAAAPTTGVPAGETTATVTRRTLTESSTVDGTLGYGTSLELYDRVSGTFTWLPSVGATVSRGGTLWRVNNLPVVLMYGSVPAYRTLKEGVSDGPDVTQLNENLIDLGYDPYGAITDDEEFGEATAAAVRRWQKAEGLRETGEVELGRVVFAPGARRVTAVKVALGQDPPGAAGAEGPSSKKPSSDAPDEEPGTNGHATEKKAAKEKEAKEKAAKEKADKERHGKEPAEEPNDKDASKEPDDKEAAKTPADDDESEGKEPAGGSEGASGAGMVVLSTTSTQQLVQLKVKAEQQTLAHVGETAPVTLPGGDVVQGRIIEVGSVASTSSSGESEKGSAGSSGESESATIPVTLALARPVAHLDEAPVSVELVKSVRRDVLAVPATALTATAGNPVGAAGNPAGAAGNPAGAAGYAIEVLASSPEGEGTRRVALAVTPGMFAGGYVQVEGPGVREGLTVIESE
jgi:peptidoglycan hydrolase-like protein with peptidoglycan-binding domain